MYIGFDYGTSNCAAAVMEQGRVRRLPLDGQDPYLTSTLYAPHRDAIPLLLANALDEPQRQRYLQQHAGALAKAQRARRELEEEGLPFRCLLGKAATEQYLLEPEEGYYLKSPKSFLGATGLSTPQLTLFRDLVAIMMLHIRRAAENALQREVKQAVIGQPVNFQGLRGDDSNRQARALLVQAAELAGFAEIQFQYEPIAAGLEYESTLRQEQTVLVIDIGGGTTDCSVLRMGPGRRGAPERDADLLAHTGMRLGGNDLDIRLAVLGLMPLCGLDGINQRGLPMPHSLFWDAMSINDLQAQSRFFADATGRQLQTLLREVRQPEQLSRLAWIRQHRQTHHMVWEAEQMKMQLSEQTVCRRTLLLHQQALEVDVSQLQMAAMLAPLLEKIGSLADDAIHDAATQPDVIFLTGGSARSPLIRDVLAARYPSIPLVTGDHAGSVIAGLARWAEHCFA
ncbi:molecular chaperone [Pseudaeromonas sharmana]|uniref:Molecular chaperone n=1 Tax=Pseudaeromonas sharmana TaxID=328412 RepID=A0ABV8CL62_9GAMM